MEAVGKWGIICPDLVGGTEIALRDQPSVSDPRSSANIQDRYF
jgi:hypothetical protein